MRLLFGVHRLSGQRHPFVGWDPGGGVPVASSLHAAVVWLASVERVRHTLPSRLHTPRRTFSNTHQQEKPFSLAHSATPHLAPTLTIRAWCAKQDPLAPTGRYVELNSRRQGCCPFEWRHANGHDEHASSDVYMPVATTRRPAVVPLTDRYPCQHIGLEGQPPDDALRVSDDDAGRQGHLPLLLHIDRFRNDR